MRAVIDFYEFAFLTEACIPPGPIARAFFWQNVIDRYYHAMTEGERYRLHKWITSNPKFDVTDEDCDLFDARFNPNNQFTVVTEYKGEDHSHDCFMWKGKYHMSKSASINEEYIKTVYPLKIKSQILDFQA